MEFFPMIPETALDSDEGGSNIMSRNLKLAIIMISQWTLLTALAVAVLLTRPVQRFSYQTPVGAVVALGGFAIMTAALIVYHRANRDSTINIVPTPHQRARLVTNGIYAFVRHPIYLGVVLVTAGILIWYATLPIAILWVLIVVFVQIKSRYEESLLLERYAEYEEYRQRTGRILPRLIAPRQR